MGLFDLFKPNVEKLESSKDIAGLLKALQDKKNPEIRDAAGVALGRISDQQIVNPLLQAVKDGNVSVLQASTILGKIGNKGGIEPLIHALRDNNVNVRCTVATALGQVGDKRAIDPLIHVLETDDNTTVRSDAAHSLARLGWQSTNDIQNAWYLIALEDWEKLLKLGEPAIEPLVQVIKLKGNNSRVTAVKILGQIGGAKAVDPLIDLLHDEDSLVREIAALWLGEIGDRKAVKPLIQVLESRDYLTVRHYAAQSLKKMGDTSATNMINAVELEAENEGRALVQRFF